MYRHAEDFAPAGMLDLPARSGHHVPMVGEGPSPIPTRSASEDSSPTLRVGVQRKIADDMEPSRAEDYEALQLEVIRQRWDQKADHWDADLADPCCHLHQDDGYRRFLDAADSVVAARERFAASGCSLTWPAARAWCWPISWIASPGPWVSTSARGCWPPRPPGGCRASIARSQLLRARRRGSRARPGPCSRAASCCRTTAIAGSAPLFGQVREVLSPDGGFAILDFLNARTRHDYPANPDNKTYYTAEQIQSHALEAGFRRANILGEPDRRASCCCWRSDEHRVVGFRAFQPD